MAVYSTRIMKSINSEVLLYTKNKRPVKKTDVPANIFARLEAGEKEVDDTNIKLEAPVRLCLFCGISSKLTRSLDSKTVVLCEEHYHNKRIGQIAQQLRENNHGQSAQGQAQQESQSVHKVEGESEGEEIQTS